MTLRFGSLTITQLLAFVPEGGCLMVFNADSNVWRTRVSLHNRGVANKLSCNAMDTYKYTGVRDLRITRKEA